MPGSEIFARFEACPARAPRLEAEAEDDMPERSTCSFPLFSGVIKYCRFERSAGLPIWPISPLVTSATRHRIRARTVITYEQINSDGMI
jgi:hypothetical protein